MGKPKKSARGFSKGQPPELTCQNRVTASTEGLTGKHRQAISLIRQGRLLEAETIYRHMVSLGEVNFAVFSGLGTICGMQGRYNEMIDHLSLAVELNPNDADVYNNLAVAYRKIGKLDAAILAYRQALRIKPEYLKCHYNLGNALLEQGDYEAAILSYKRAKHLTSHREELFNNLGNAYNKLGNHDDAIASYKYALNLNPGYGQAHNNLANALHLQGNTKAAIDSYRAALAICPESAEAFRGLGVALQDEEDLEGAISCYQRSLEINSDCPDALANLGSAYHLKGDLAAALKYYTKSLEIIPDHIDIRFKSAILKLTLGDYRSGWEGYELRFKLSKGASTPYAMPSPPMWQGQAITNTNERLLLVSEQGLGDTLQFMRYIIALRKQNISPSLCTLPKLHGLIKASGIDVAPLSPEDANSINSGLWSPLLSVPKYLGVDPENPIITEPYIRTTDELLRKWGDVLSQEARPIIGINWQGNPDPEKKSTLKGRSMPLEVFKSLTVLDNISLLSLQKGFGSEQLEVCSFKNRFVSCQSLIDRTWDFLETAAIIANCDLVITTDSSMAHLAGGMGKPTWLLLHDLPDWRWGLSGESTFWYPSMRLFRQRERGNWKEVLERVREALQQHT